MFRAASTRDKHSRSSCNISLTCVKCTTEFSSQRKYTTHVRRCNGQHVSIAPLLPTFSPTSDPAPDPASGFASSSAPPPAPATPADSPQSAATSSRAHPPLCGFDLPGASGDMASSGGLRGTEDQYTVTIDNEMPTLNQPAGPKLFDLGHYLDGEIDFDDLLDYVH